MIANRHGMELKQNCIKNLLIDAIFSESSVKSFIILFDSAQNLHDNLNRILYWKLNFNIILTENIEDAILWFVWWMDVIKLNIFLLKLSVEREKGVIYCGVYSWTFKWSFYQFFTNFSSPKIIQVIVLYCINKCFFKKLPQL